MADTHDRRMHYLLIVLIAAMVLLIVAQRCQGQVIKFVPQPRPSKHVRVYSALVCSDPSSSEPMAVNLATITRYAPPELPLLNPYARSYEQNRNSRHVLLVIGDTIADGADSFVIGVGTGAIKYKGKLPKLAAGYAFLWQRARNPVNQFLNRALSEQEFWGDLLIQIPAHGGCQQAAVAALRSENKAERRAIEARSIEVKIPVTPPLSRLVSPSRFDAIDWDRQAAQAAREVAEAVCLIRPSSVEDEGCGAWYG